MKCLSFRIKSKTKTEDKKMNEEEVYGIGVDENEKDNITIKFNIDNIM